MIRVRIVHHTCMYVIMCDSHVVIRWRSCGGDRERLGGEPTVVAVDVNGSRPIDAVLAVLANVVS